MLFNILPYVLVLAICVKVPMTRRLIMKYPIISKIGLMLLNFIKDIVFSNARMQGKTQYPNHLYSFNAGGIMSSNQTTSIMDTPWNHNIAYSYLPGNVYYNSSLENN